MKLFGVKNIRKSRGSQKSQHIEQMPTQTRPSSLYTGGGYFRSCTDNAIGTCMPLYGSDRLPL